MVGVYGTLYSVLAILHKSKAILKSEVYIKKEKRKDIDM